MLSTGRWGFCILLLDSGYRFENRSAAVARAYHQCTLIETANVKRKLATIAIVVPT
jgi:hypothetical protein